MSAASAQEGRRADVLVLGGGICSRLSRTPSAPARPQRHPIERDRIGQRASGVNFGGVRQQGRALRELPLSRRARTLWDLQGLIGIDGEFTVGGHLRLGRSDADMAIIEQHCRDAAEHELHFELLGRNAVMARFPWLGQIVHGGSFAAEDGHANARWSRPLSARQRAGPEPQSWKRSRSSPAKRRAMVFA